LTAAPINRSVDAEQTAHRHDRAARRKPLRQKRSTHMRKSIISTMALGSLALVALVGVRVAPHAAADGQMDANISPFEIMLENDMTKLPLEEFKDGECPARC
jgi:hypothetical protein